MKHALVATVCAFSFVLPLASSFAADKPVSYKKQIRPLLEQHCSECHDADNKHGDLDVTNYYSLKRGGESGRAITPGETDESLLFLLVTGKQQPKMPKKGQPLSSQDIELLRKWIQQGAHTD